MSNWGRRNELLVPKIDRFLSLSLSLSHTHAHIHKNSTFSIFTKLKCIFAEHDDLPDVFLPGQSSTSTRAQLSSYIGETSKILQNIASAMFEATRLMERVDLGATTGDISYSETTWKE